MLNQNKSTKTKPKPKGRVIIYLHETGTARFTISEVTVGWQEPMVLQRKCGHPLPALTDIGPAAAASKHTTVPISHTRHSPHKHSPDSATPSDIASLGISSITFTQCALEANEFSEIMQNKGHCAVQSHSKSPILVPSESSHKSSY